MPAEASTIRRKDVDALRGRSATSSIIWRLRTFSALWIPGVSIRTICASSRFTNSLNAIPRGLRLRRDDRDLAPNQRVDEGGLARVRATHNCDESGFECHSSILREARRGRVSTRVNSWLAKVLVQSASGLGRSWNFTTLLVVPLPPSMCWGARVAKVDHSPLPFQPAFASSMRPSILFAKNPIG